MRTRQIDPKDRTALYPGRVNKTKLENQVGDGSLALDTKTTAGPGLMFNSNFLPSTAQPMQ